MSKAKSLAQSPQVIVPKLPSLLAGKLYKTGQTRGADDDVIFQNRMGRNSTVLIPYSLWSRASNPPEGENKFEKGFIALLSPEKYFESPTSSQEMAEHGLFLGDNALIFYETREEWLRYNPHTYNAETQRWVPAERRTSPLAGQYAARVPATTAAQGGEKVIRGYSTKKTKGAGIRVYEYASKQTITLCRMQLELLLWHCQDASDVLREQGMSIADISTRRDKVISDCQQKGLADMERLQMRRLVNKKNNTVCPLCLEDISAAGFFNKVEQAEGRLVPDLTITQLNLFHIKELRFGFFGHQPYNLGWGHHHCNVVVKDAGIEETVIWMDQVIDRNIQAGYLVKG